MVSHQGFRILGYVYAILGIAGTILDDSLLKAYAGVEKVEALRYGAMADNLLSFVFYAILLVGMLKNDSTLVEIHRIFLIVKYVMIIGCTLILVVTRNVSHDEDVQFSYLLFTLQIFFLITLIITGLYSLFLWIVNGVIVAIKSIEDANGKALNQFLDHNKQGKPYYAPV